MQIGAGEGPWALQGVLLLVFEMTYYQLLRALDDNQLEMA